ncbi:MAG TPA: hypothetical protein VEI25_14680 [Paraburkholderia sp.]|nr:hypothetical protein [Paraburkholderia sp.]
MPFTSSGEKHAASYRLPVLADVFGNMPAWANDALCWNPNAFTPERNETEVRGKSGTQTPGKKSARSDDPIATFA